jgi:regulatory protein
MEPSKPSAYTIALRMLARRELSVAQVRERLTRKGVDAAAVQDAVSRLVANGTLDDLRVARAVARTRANVKRQGRSRVVRELANIGISRDIAQQVISEVFGDLDEQALLDEALTRRLRGSVSLSDAAARRRITGALLRQGFSPGDIQSAIRKRRNT